VDSWRHALVSLEKANQIEVSALCLLIYGLLKVERLLVRLSIN